MLRLKKKKDPALELIEQHIEAVSAHMLTLDSSTKEYAEANKQLSELITTRTKMTPGKGIKPEIWIPAAANLVGILLVINHERVGIIGTKAMGLIVKPKI